MDELSSIEYEQQLLLKQIQFYFSPANLLTDQHLIKTLKSCNNHWLPLTYLLRCKKIQQLMAKLHITLKQRKRYIYKILQESKVLKVRKYRVKMRVRFNAKKQRKKIIYIELENQSAVDFLEKRLAKLEDEHNLKINLKKGQRWLFIVIVDNQHQKLVDLERYLRAKGSSLEITSILNGAEWQQKEKLYQQVINKIRKQTYQRQQLWKINTGN